MTCLRCGDEGFIWANIDGSFEEIDCPDCSQRVYEKRLAEIEARLVEITPYEWYVDKIADDWEDEVTVVKADDGKTFVAKTVDGDNNAHFIANAPNDIADLCAALREERRRHTELADIWADEHHERTFAECENRRLREKFNDAQIKEDDPDDEIISR